MKNEEFPCGIHIAQRNSSFFIKLDYFISLGRNPKERQLI